MPFGIGKKSSKGQLSLTEVKMGHVLHRKGAFTRDKACVKIKRALIAKGKGDRTCQSKKGRL